MSRSGDELDLNDNRTLDNRTLVERLEHREKENGKFRLRIKRQRAHNRSLNKCVVEQQRSITRLLDANEKHRPAYVPAPPPPERDGRQAMVAFVMLMLGVILGVFWREIGSYMMGRFQ